MNCPFCEIDKKEPSRVIMKDDLVLVFPTNIPITPGHTLICPSRHVSRIDDLTKEEVFAIKDTILKVKNSMVQSLGSEGFNVAWNEGSMAGQAVEHMHIHIVPRKTGDTGIYEYDPRKFLYRPGSRETSPDQELNDIAEVIRKNIL